MKTPLLVLQLLAATALAASWPAHADAFHGSTKLAGITAGHGKSLSSNLTPHAALASSFDGTARESIDGSLADPLRQTGMAFGRTRVDLRIGTHSAPMLGNVPTGPSLAAASRAVLDHELAQLRDGIERVRFMPQVSLGASLKL